jgi:hypothetical protein
MHADSIAATVPTVTLGPCAILILVVMVVSVNRAQEILIKLASIQCSTPTSEPMNAKVFAPANKQALVNRSVNSPLSLIPWNTGREELMKPHPRIRV